MVLEGLEGLEQGLLGFSGGGDSVALFYLLLERGVPFDLAIVDHGLRAQASLEVAYAKELGARHGKKVHIKRVRLQGGNLEAKGRQARYLFFEGLIQEFGYTHLILAHHLNDKLEWFLMQLAKGASLQTLLGFSALEPRANYTLVRPLIYTPKATLLEYLHAHKHRYFEDSTNNDLRFKRNLIRHHLATPFLDLMGARGVVRSFQALELEKHSLYPSLNYLKLKGVFVFKTGGQNLYYIGGLLKKLGYVLSRKQRLELMQQGLNGGLGGGLWWGAGGGLCMWGEL
ncbi:tRNA lysidine(34) synthetase TilS [Helicobacter heilmannii]|uniref:tRNA lysidine(34) synthetase TilS n=1 Tax=Helicobacter heilmannii TaxID=35817 RepID=UPI000A8CD8FC|nr:tRNA lysidine(34) synthetase TilS [Helicobacter heilmannii]